jgi:hypothetical protein
MLQTGMWLKNGNTRGWIIAWGIEVGFSPKGGSPVKKTSRKKAVASGMPMVLISTGKEEVWYPLEACEHIPTPVL